MKTFGIINSVVLWCIALWALAQPIKTELHWGILALATAIMLVHFFEVSFFFWHPKMKPHLSAKNIGLVLLCGAFHFMPLYKGQEEKMS